MCRCLGSTFASLACSSTAFASQQTWMLDSPPDPCSLPSFPTGRRQVVDLDLFGPEPLPRGHDVLTLSMVLHDWGLPRKMLLMRKVRPTGDPRGGGTAAGGPCGGFALLLPLPPAACRLHPAPCPAPALQAYAALPPGGALVAVDNLVDDCRRDSPLQLGMSLTMLLEFGAEAAFDYSAKVRCGEGRGAAMPWHPVCRRVCERVCVCTCGVGVGVEGGKGGGVGAVML